MKEHSCSIEYIKIYTPDWDSLHEKFENGGKGLLTVRSPDFMHPMKAKIDIQFCPYCGEKLSEEKFNDIVDAFNSIKKDDNHAIL